MKAILYTEYGPPEVLQLKEVEKPIPGEDEVLVEIYATAVTTADANARGFVFIPAGFGFLPRSIFGLRKPEMNILGTGDNIYDTVGNTTFSGCKDSLTQNGLYLAGAGGLREFVQTGWTSIFSSQKVKAGMAPEHKEDLIFLKELCEKEQIKPVIDRRYLLERTAEAHRYVDTGHKKGSVVITVDHNSKT